VLLLLHAFADTAPWAVFIRLFVSLMYTWLPRPLGLYKECAKCQTNFRFLPHLPQRSERMFVATILSLATVLFAPSVYAGTIPSQSGLPYNFTLAALNSSLPNANSTGAPLVLGQNGQLPVWSPLIASIITLWMVLRCQHRSFVLRDIRAYNYYLTRIRFQDAPR
jgi:hypothetical protein